MIVIPPLNQRNGATAPNDRLPYHNAHRRVKDFLKDLLRPEVERHETHPIPALKQLTSSQIVDGLRHQLDAYWHNEWPFDQQVDDNNPLNWWESLQYHRHASVLAVSILLATL